MRPYDVVLSPAEYDALAAELSKPAHPEGSQAPAIGIPDPGFNRRERRALASLNRRRITAAKQSVRRVLARASR